VNDEDRIHCGDAEDAKKEVFSLAGRYRQTKRILFLKRRLLTDPTAIKGVDLNPRGTEFLLQSPSPDWSRRKISLCDLSASAVKPGFFNKNTVNFREIYRISPISTKSIST
jgi:hypothetical protein